MCVHIDATYRLMCAQRFLEPLNLNIRHPEIIDRRNTHMGWRMGETRLVLCRGSNIQGWASLSFFFIPEAAMGSVSSSLTKPLP